LAIGSPELRAGTSFEWLPWGPHELSGVPTLPELEVTGELFPFEPVFDVVEDFKIATVFWDTGEVIRGYIMYRSDLFAANTIDRFVGDLRSAAKRLVESPYASFSTDFDPGGHALNV